MLQPVVGSVKNKKCHLHSLSLSGYQLHMINFWVALMHHIDILVSLRYLRNITEYLHSITLDLSGSFIILSLNYWYKDILGVSGCYLGILLVP